MKKKIYVTVRLSLRVLPSHVDDLDEHVCLRLYSSTWDFLTQCLSQCSIVVKRNHIEGNCGSLVEISTHKFMCLNAWPIVNCIIKKK